MIESLRFNHFQVNCYVVYDEQSRECIIVDPATESVDEEQALDAFIGSRQLTVRHIIVTHPHLDHTAGLRHACQTYGLPAMLHPDGAYMLAQAEDYSVVMGFDVRNMTDLAVAPILEGDVIEAGAISLEARYVPGHCTGSLVFVDDKDQAVITGDALFHLSIGRTDLPGGNQQLLVDGIRNKILTLPDNYLVLPGHSIKSTVGKERRHNPFLRP